MLHTCMCLESLAYVMVLHEKKDKVDVKIIKCMFLGYCKGLKAFRFLCLETKNYNK